MTDQPDLKARVEEDEYSYPNSAFHAVRAELDTTRGQRDDWKSHAQAAESRLALADRLAEAGKPFAEALAAHDADVVSWPKSAVIPGPLATVGLPIKLGHFRALSAALKEYDS